MTSAQSNPNPQAAIFRTNRAQPTVDKLVIVGGKPYTRATITHHWQHASEILAAGFDGQSMTRLLAKHQPGTQEAQLSWLLMAQGIVYERRMRLAESLIPQRLLAEYTEEALDLERSIWHDCEEVRSRSLFRRAARAVCRKEVAYAAVGLFAFAAILHPDVHEWLEFGILGGGAAAVSRLARLRPVLRVAAGALPRARQAVRACLTLRHVGEMAHAVVGAVRRSA